jgi:hypothetical protein
MSRVPSFARAAGALLLVASLPSPATAAESYDGCSGYVDALPAVVSSAGTWCLRKDLGTAIRSGTALSITANNVTLDCNGFKVGGLAGGSTSTATGISSSASATTIRGCSVRGFATGIHASGFGAMIDGNRIEGALALGILMAGDGAVARRNRLLDIGGLAGAATAIGSSGADRVEIADNRVDGLSSLDDGVWGIAVSDGTGHVINDNTVRGLVAGASASAVGVSLAGADAIVADNQLESPVAAGTAFECADSYHLIRDNSVLGFATQFGGECVDHGGNVHRLLVWE